MAKRPPVEEPSRSARLARAGGVALACFALAAGVLLFGRFALVRAAERLAEGEEFRLSRDRVAATPSPAWIKDDLVARSLRVAGETGSTVELARKDLVPRLAEAFEASPWVERVRIKKGAGRLEIEVDYRRPVLFVPWGDGKKGCYVDGAARVLPAEDADPDSLRACPVLAGLPASKLPGLGQSFGEPGIVQAAKLAALLAGEQARLGIATIQATSGSGERTEFALRARRGVRANWGPIGTPEEETAKRERLLAEFDRPAAANDAGSPADLDLTGTNR